jgi:hypothetical protein
LNGARPAALTDAQVRAGDRAKAIDTEAQERAAELGRKIVALVDAQMRTEETVRKVGQRIDNLAVTVERHIADGHGGGARAES